ncbi:MAG TPA: hypothetical protein VHK88_09985, partial [Aquihabitans sp.]|nr:hypothetical protein [Aquihabitans sp.]
MPGVSRTAAMGPSVGTGGAEPLRPGMLFAVPPPQLITVPALDPVELEAVRRIMDDAFEGDFDDDDWDHALGGLHVVVRDGDTVVAHAAVVERVL